MRKGQKHIKDGVYRLFHFMEEVICRHVKETQLVKKSLEVDKS